MENKYRSKNHSKFLIKLHFVFAVKYRKRLLFGEINDDIKQIIYDVCSENGYIVDQMESDIDHLHILVDIEPKVSALEFAHKIKQITTFRIYQKHRHFLKTRFWKENTFWSDGYFVCSVGDASIETIKKYIKEQG
jgi:putative transposase